MIGKYVHSGTEFEFEYSDVLTATQRINLVIEIEHAILSDGHYLSLMKDIVTKYCVVKYYAPGFEYPVPIIDQDGELDWDEIEIFFESTGLFDIILSGIDRNQFFEIIECLNDDISYQTGIDKTNITNELIALIRTLKESIENSNKIFSDDIGKSVLAFIRNFNKADMSKEDIVNLLVEDHKPKTTRKPRKKKSDTNNVVAFTPDTAVTDKISDDVDDKPKE